MTILSRVGIVYYGNAAENHTLDGREFGDSLIGASRIYTTLSHTIIEGKIPGKRTRPASATYVSPPRDGSLAVDLLVDIFDVSHVLAPVVAINADIVKDCFGFVLEWTMSTIDKIWKDEKSQVDKSFEIIDKLIAQNTELTNGAIAAVDRAGAREHELSMGILRILENSMNGSGGIASRVHSLADATRSSGRKMLEPVGRSCVSEAHTIKSVTTPPIQFEEEVATKLRADDGEIIGDLQEYKVYVDALDKQNSSGKIEFSKDSPIYRAKIHDPSLSKSIHSVYTRALDSGSRIVIKAKPVMTMDGELKSFHIMDAEDDGASSAA